LIRLFDRFIDLGEGFLALFVEFFGIGLQ